MLSKEEWLTEIIEKLQEHLLPKTTITQKFKHEKYANGEFSFVPTSLYSLYPQLITIDTLTYNKNGLNFVDVGCGIGNILLMANIILGKKCSYMGIETSKEYIYVAQKLNPKAIIVNMDAKEVDYSIFDIIYFFCPHSSYIKEHTLEERIANTAKSGAYIVANNADHYVWYNEKLFTKITNHIYQKV